MLDGPYLRYVFVISLVYFVRITCSPIERKTTLSSHHHLNQLIQRTEFSISDGVRQRERIMTQHVDMPVNQR